MAIVKTAISIQRSLFEQAEALAKLSRGARERGLRVVCLTGHTLEELRAPDRPGWAELLSHIDLLVAGPYVQEQPCEEPLRASTNQQLHFLTGRIKPDDLRGLPRVEVIAENGELRISGFDPQLSRRLRDALAREEDDDA